MEILISVVSFVVALLITVVSIKLAAGWMDAEHNGWGRCLGALILAYVVAAGISLVGGLIFAFLPNVVGMIVVAIAVVVAIVAPVFVFARVLGTSGWRAFAILLISAVVNMVIWGVILFGLAAVLGVGIAGLGGLMGLGGLTPDVGGGDVDEEALNRFEAGVEELCACTDASCANEVSPAVLEDMMAAVQSTMTSTDPSVNARMEALTSLMDECQQFDEAAAGEPEVEHEPMAKPETMEEPVGEPTPAPAPAPARASSAVAAPAAKAPSGYVPYALHDVAVARTPSLIGKLVRITLADGSRRSDQLVAYDGTRLTLKRDKSEGGTRYTVAASDVVRMQVFDK